MNFNLFDTDLEKGALLILTTQQADTVVYDAPESYKAEIVHFLKHSGYKSKTGEIAFLVAQDGRQILLSSAGSFDKFTQDNLRKALGRALKEARKQNAASVALLQPTWALQDLNISWVQIAAETCHLALYEYNNYFSSKEDFIGFEAINIQCDKLSSENTEALNAGDILGHSTTISRDLINETSIDLYPETLANKVVEFGKNYGFDVQIFGADECQDMEMHALMAVGQASTRLPRLIVMRWVGGSNMEPIGLIGKGVTYDTGGLSLKPTASMLHMKSDMSGAATVIATMCALARMGSKKNVVGVVAACENAVAGNAYRPGDVINSMNGKTIEIGNTDAEGRLTLADAITYAIRKEHVNTIIDLATLTGAVKVALGDHVAGAVTTNQALYDNLKIAEKSADENFWQLPIDDEYRDLNSSEIADIKNIGRDGLAGTITAAAFVEAFTEGLPWLHLDIAGVSFFRKEHDYISKGASGRAMRSLYHLVERIEH